jgi:hypothetical protein
LIESLERRNVCDTEISAETLIAGGTLAGIVSRTVRPNSGASSITRTATTDEEEEAARVAIAARVPNGAMCAQQFC